MTLSHTQKAFKLLIYPSFLGISLEIKSLLREPQHHYKLETILTTETEGTQSETERKTGGSLPK